VEVYLITDLASLVEHLKGTQIIAKQEGITSLEQGGETVFPVVFEDVKGWNASKPFTEASLSFTFRP
jgi:hypothetical protein